MSLVLFDLNNVLFSYDKQIRINELARISGMAAGDVEAAIWGSGFEDSGDTGLLSAEAYLAEFGRRIGHALDLEAWTVALRRSVAPMPAALAIAGKVGRTTRIAVLTNNNLLVRRQIDALFPALRAIFHDAIHVSAEFQACKPDALAYERCLRVLGATPEETLFIDDGAANVAGAEQAGLMAYRFTTVPALEAELTRRGIP